MRERLIWHKGLFSLFALKKQAREIGIQVHFYFADKGTDWGVGIFLWKYWVAIGNC